MLGRPIVGIFVSAIGRTAIGRARWPHDLRLVDHPDVGPMATEVRQNLDQALALV